MVSTRNAPEGPGAVSEGYIAQEAFGIEAAGRCFT
jgi:hypothetical protein